MSSLISNNKITTLFAGILILFVIVAILLQYDSHMFLNETTKTGKVERMKLTTAKTNRNSNNNDIKPLKTVHEPISQEIMLMKKKKIEQEKEEQDGNRNHDSHIEHDENTKQQEQKQHRKTDNHHHHLHLHPLSDSEEDINDYLLHHRSLNGRLLLIPVNSGYLDFGLNLLCSLENVSSSLVSTEEDPLHFHYDQQNQHDNRQNQDQQQQEDSTGIGYTFVAMDEQVEQDLKQMHLPVFKDPKMPFVSSKSAEWANPKFHHLVCTKLFPVLRALKQNLSVVLSDADIVFRKDPFKYFINRNHLDMIFSIGSCHRDLPDDHDLPRAGDGLGKLNTGFYIVNNNNQNNNNINNNFQSVIDLFSDALKRCIDSNTNSNTHHEAGEGDQPAMNAVLDENVRKYQQKMLLLRKKSAEDIIRNDNKNDNNNHNRKIHYGFFDGCLFANGCIYFKHLCANSTSLDPASKEAIDILRRGGKMPHYKNTAALLMKMKHNNNHDENNKMIRRDDPVLVHANFLVGKDDKIKHLKRYGLWNQKCIDHLKTKKKTEG